MIIAEIFLTMALALPAEHFTQPTVVRWSMARSEEEKLTEWLRKNNPDAEVFINERPQEDELKQNGWERVPINWRGKQIWIKRKPATDKRLMETQS